MLDLTSMSPEQQEELIKLFEIAADNPFEQLKLDFLTAALTFKEWVEKNATVNQKELNTMWSGVENAVTRHFQDAQKAIAQKTGIKLIQ